MQFRDYLRFRRLAFALKEIRDTEKGILDIALNYGITPSEYRQNPIPVVLRTIIKPFDYEQQNCGVEQKIERAIKGFNNEERVFGDILDQFRRLGNIAYRL